MTTEILVAPNHPLEAVRAMLSNTNRAYMISPYVKESFIKRLIEPISMIGDVRLIARLTSFEISTNSVDLSALDLIAQYGDVKCLSTLHAKGILTDNQAYIGSLNFTHSAFFRNYEMGVITDSPNVISDFEVYFSSVWERALPLNVARRHLIIDEVMLQTVGWQKVREWWEIISNIDLREYNPQAQYIVFLPMPRPPLDRANMIIKPVLRHLEDFPNVEVVMFSELYGAIPYRFSDQFGVDGEYYFDEAASKFYAGNTLSEDAKMAAQTLSKFITKNSSLKLVAPLPDNYKRTVFLETASQYSQFPVQFPRVISPFIGYMRNPASAIAFLRLAVG